jgi:hypothetical protein
MPMLARTVINLNQIATVLKLGGKTENSIIN